MGKLGALTATIAYNYIDTETKIWVVCWFGLLGAVLTYVFVPDTTGLDFLRNAKLEIVQISEV